MVYLYILYIYSEANQLHEVAIFCHIFLCEGVN